MRYAFRVRLVTSLIPALCGVFCGGALRAGEETPLKVRYIAGEGLQIGNEEHQIAIQGRLQGRFTYDVLEAAPDKDTWAVARGRLKIEGYTLAKKFRFQLQMNFATRNAAKTREVCADAGCTEMVEVITSESTSGLPVLNDYYVDYVPYSFFGVKVGQFKVPFLLEELTSSGRLQSVDRSLANDVFSLERDIGVAFHGELWKDGLQYSAFAMNGDGANTLNRNQSLMAGLRLELPVFGEYRYSQPDVEDSRDPNLGLGIAYAFNDLGRDALDGTIPAGTRLSTGTLDAFFKFRGLSAQAAAMLARSHDAPAMTHWGYSGQIGYFLIPKHFEVVLRSGGAVFSGAIPNPYEHMAGLNWYLKGHGLKFQTDYALLMNPRGLNLNDQRIRTQVQVVF